MERGIRNDEGIRNGTGHQKQNKASECSGTPEAPEWIGACEWSGTPKTERRTRTKTGHQKQNGAQKLEGAPETGHLPNSGVAAVVGERHKVLGDAVLPYGRRLELVVGDLHRPV